MPIWLFFLGVATVAIAAGGRKRTPASGGGSGLLGSRSPIGAPPVLGVVAMPEKFMDPMFLCFGSTQPADPGLLPEGYLQVTSAAPYVIGTPNTFGVPRDVGYAYLSTVPNTASARVAAVRDRINKSPKPPTVTPGFSPSTLFESLRKSSYDNLAKVAAHITSTFGDTANLTEVAKAYGLPLSEVSRKAAAIRDAAMQTSQYKVIDAAVREVAPIANALAGALSQAASGKYDPSYLAVSTTIRFASQFLPIFGPMLASSLALFDAAFEQKKNVDAELCRNTVDRIQRTADEMLRINLPVPWHAAETPGYSPACQLVKFGAAGAYRETPDQLRLLELYERNNAYFTARKAAGIDSPTVEGKGLTQQERAYVQRWWSTALTFMDDPRVAEVFYALGRDAYGGSLASDEQVMLVAAPIAVSYGLPVDDFARKLWAKSNGWRAGNQDSFVRKPYVHWTGGADDPILVACRTGDASVRDAWWVQWAVLAKDAYDLAQTLRGLKPGTKDTTSAAGGGILSTIGR